MSDNKSPIPTYIIPLLAFVSLVIIGFSLFFISMLDNKQKPIFSKSILNFGSSRKIGGDYKLVSTDGKIYTQDNLKNKVSLMYFGFSYCPDVCPAAMQMVSVALDHLPEYALNETQAFFVTLDPARDDAKQIKSFLENFHHNIIGLTGDMEEIKKAANSYKVFFKKIESEGENTEDYLLDHSSIIYLMGKNGEYIKHFSVNSTSEEISKEILKLLVK